MASPDDEIARAKRVLLEAHQQYLRYVQHGGVPKGAQLDFSGEDLRYARFADADMSYANLDGTRFRKADLQGCDFHLADLEGSKLGRARLKGVQIPRRESNLQPK
jgi:uncharacterized protein YjbI with pentapeptide repeats